MDVEPDRIEMRDGRAFKVMVLPERTRRTRRKPIRTRRDVRAQAMIKNAGLGLDAGRAVIRTPGR